MFKKQLVILIPALVLTACGGGSDTTTQSGKDSYDYSAIDYSLIKGLYNADYDQDENLIYISSDGFFKAYNYIGDAVDGGWDCYVEASENQVNASYMNQRLKYDENTRQYYVYPNRTDFWGDFELRWEFDSNDTLSQVYIETYSSNNSMQLSNSDSTFKASITSFKVADDDLLVQSKLCPQG